MGSKNPKWLTKQNRKRASEARRLARAKNPGTKNLGVPRVAKHGGNYKAAHP